MRERSPNDPKRCPWKPRTARAHSGEAEGRPPTPPTPARCPPSGRSPRRGGLSAARGRTEFRSRSVTTAFIVLERTQIQQVGS